GEQVGWRRWGAIGLGFVGVLMIIRPGMSGFDPAAAIVLITVIAITVRDLVTRRVPCEVSSSVVSFQGFASLALAGGMLMLLPGQNFTPMTGGLATTMACAVVFSAVGYYGIVAAMRIGDASAVSPFRYTRLLFSLIVGVLVFGERPDALMLTGAALIIGTGLYTFLRERHLARKMA
ncbi:MAG: DMT family transporter, partial [Hyphomicrobiales bacterium]|nr:DMT family transporter [Hyphomicrobiales bacterium]